MVDQKIVEQAKKIMDSFVKALEHAKNLDPEFKVKRDKNIREDEELFVNEDFSNRMLDNAPQVKNNCIVAETKKWKN